MYRKDRAVKMAVSAAAYVCKTVRSRRFSSMKMVWNKYIVVRCSNRQNGKEARQVCSVSCIGCGICEKTCTAGAIKVTEHCAVIDESVCLSCGMCVVKCPRHVLTDLRGIIC